MFNLFLFLFSRGRKDYYTFLISLLPRNKKLAEQTHPIENKDFFIEFPCGAENTKQSAVEISTLCFQMRERKKST